MREGIAEKGRTESEIERVGVRDWVEVRAQERGRE